ncbi:HAD-like domain-containing protein [Aspergillus unguis]
MDIKRCGLGVEEPVFHPATDIQAIVQDFYTKGIAFIKGCNEMTLADLAGQFGIIVRPRHEKLSGTGISHIRFAPALIGKGYSNAELFFHTDRSGWDHPPDILISTLNSKSVDGGESLLADTSRILKEIKEQGDGLYELITDAKNSSFRNDDGVFVPRQIFDEETDIFRFRFDDGIMLSPALVLRFRQMYEIFYRNSFAVALQEGEGYFLNNHKFLHGRTGFTGSRELLRVLVNLPSPMSAVTILFDVDGTLCRSEEMSVDAFFSCLTDVSGKYIAHANTTVSLHGRTDLGLLQGILDFHDVKDKASVIEKFLQLHPEYLEKSMQKGFLSVPCEGVLDTLEWVAAKKQTLQAPTLRVGLMTGNSCANALLKLKAAGINTDIFDLSISAFGDSHIDRISLIEDSMAKLRAKDGAGFDESKVVVVGDTPLDIECAKKAGCAVVAVASGNYPLEDLAMHEPDHACTRISESKNYLESYLHPSVPVMSG